MCVSSVGCPSFEESSMIIYLHPMILDLLQDLRRATRDARAEWKNIGMELGLSPGDIAVSEYTI